MIEKIDYIKRNNGITIVRCYGTGQVLELPERIAGLPVTELADHCFAGEASVRYTAEEMQTAYRSEGKEEEYGADGPDGLDGADGADGSNGTDGADLPVLSTMNIEEIILPKTLKAIGDYAFYGCRKLRSLHIPWGFQRLGGGAFVACNQIRRLHFSMESAEKTPRCLKDFIAELPFELEVIMRAEAGNGDSKAGNVDSEVGNADSKAGNGDSEAGSAGLGAGEEIRLIYPEYYEDAKENTPARIIEIVYHGTGYKYRQCFLNGRMDYHQYDRLFALAVAQEAPETVLRLALFRLETPKELLLEAKERYLSWLREEYQITAEFILQGEGMKLLRLLAEEHYYTETILEYFLNLASERKKAEEVSYLMEYRRQNFKKKKKTFDFDDFSEN
ncbi:MAG: leucine-rich repeat protein [Lachnospiraceae bacterium]|nr:leucine-rich repeat protein [Lachnospiraceae bacterium]